MIKRIGDNAYKLELPGDMHVSSTFNVVDLALYVEDDFEDKGQIALKRGRLMHTIPQAHS